jgi:hypothetical protein
MAEGYDAPIAQGLWRRVTTYGMPTAWFAVWMGAAMLQMVLSMARFGWLWGAGIALLAVGMEFLLGQWLTRQDIQWDELRLAQWMRRYHSFYDAG